jgi:hypothetical protein
MNEIVCAGCETGWTPAHSAQLRDMVAAEGLAATAAGMTRAFQLYVTARESKGRSQGRG